MSSTTVWVITANIDLMAARHVVGVFYDQATAIQYRDLLLYQLENRIFYNYAIEEWDIRSSVMVLLHTRTGEIE